MEKLVNMLAIWFHEQRTMLRQVGYRLNRLSLNGLSVLIISLFGVFPMTVYYIFSGYRYHWSMILSSYLFVVLVFALAIVVMFGWYKAKEMDRSNVHGFSFHRLPLKKLDMGYFGFDMRDLVNLERMLALLPARERIVIREIPKNKQSGNLRFLFTFLDLVVKDGIQGLGTGSRAALLGLIQDRFTFEHGDIKGGTFVSSYSKWSQKTRDGDYDDLRKRMALALGISG